MFVYFLLCFFYFC